MCRPRTSWRPQPEEPAGRGFTLVEVLIVIILLAIGAGLALPMLGEPTTIRLREAARLLAADIEFAEYESITHADAPRALVLDMSTRTKYWIAPRVAGQPGQAPLEAAAVKDPARRDPANPADFAPFVVVFGQHRAAGVPGVTIRSAQQCVVSGSLTFLPFDAYGTPLDGTGQPRASSAAPSAIELAAGNSRTTITIAPGSGEVTVLP